MLFSGDRVALAPVGEPVWDAGVRAPVLARHAGGNPGRSADLVLKELPAAS
jgi:hypothetical protein